MPKTTYLFDPSGYATVPERITLFYQHHPEGRIETDLVARDDVSITFKALVYRNETDLVAAASGWATEREGDGDINTVACLENTETSAIGRALANLGLTASKQRPSLEEMEKASRERAWRVRESAHDEGYGSMHTNAIEGCSFDGQHGAAQRPGASDLADARHSTASLVSDLLDLLGVAERAGLPAERAERVRKVVSQDPPASLTRVTELERGLRTWLARRASA